MKFINKNNIWVGEKVLEKIFVLKFFPNLSLCGEEFSDVTFDCCSATAADLVQQVKNEIRQDDRRII